MSAIKPIQLPTDEQMLRLKRELNFLLWTNDVREVPPHLRVIAPAARMEQAKINIQCVAHTVVTCGLFLHRDFRVTARGGMAFVLETSPDANPDNDRLEQIVKHWWMTLDDYGVVDLSLNAKKEKPLVYLNRSPGGSWQVAFGDDTRKRDGFLKARQQGCFYLTTNKRKATLANLQRDLGQEFLPAKEHGISLSYAALLRHVEGLLAGAEPSLIGQPQLDAWRVLAQAA